MKDLKFKINYIRDGEREVSEALLSQEELKDFIILYSDYVDFV